MYIRVYNKYTFSINILFNLLLLITSLLDIYIQKKKTKQKQQHFFILFKRKSEVGYTTHVFWCIFWSDEKIRLLLRFENLKIVFMGTAILNN